jgi:hypothetical protein
MPPGGAPAAPAAFLSLHAAVAAILVVAAPAGLGRLGMRAESAGRARLAESAGRARRAGMITVAFVRATVRTRRWWR